MKMKKRSLAILLTVLLLLALTACGSSAKSATPSAAPMPAPAAPTASGNGYWAADEAAEMPMEMEASKAAGGETGSTRASLPEGVKMIYRANLELETTEYEKAQSDIATLTNQLGGYFEEQSSNNYSSGYRSASYTVRVPAEQFETFLHQIGALCRVRYQSQTAEDVSETYYDMESRLETAKIKLDRLQELLSKAELMEDIITLESAISDTEYQIEALSGHLRHYDSLIGYSTIYVTLNEVYRVSETDNAPLTFPQRINNAFREGLRDFGSFCEDLAEWLAYSWIGLLVFLLIVLLIVSLIRRGRAKRAASGQNGLPRRTKDADPIPTQTQAPTQTAEENKAQ